MHNYIVKARWLDETFSQEEINWADEKTSDYMATFIVSSEDELTMPTGNADGSPDNATLSRMLYSDGHSYSLLGFNGHFYQPFGSSSHDYIMILMAIHRQPCEYSGYDEDFVQDESNGASYAGGEQLKTHFHNLEPEDLQTVYGVNTVIARYRNTVIQGVGMSWPTKVYGEDCVTPTLIQMWEIPQQQEIPEYEPYVPYVHPWRNPNMDCYNYNGDPTVSCDSSHIGTSGSFIQSGECV